MNHPSFQLNKVRRSIKTLGVLLSFTTPKKNEFGEPSGDLSVHKVKGLFHETQAYVSKGSSEASTTRSKSSPMVLTMWEDVLELGLDNTVNLNGKTYRVNEIKNVGESNLVADISLEEVQS